jgi:hypothetical protein
MFGAMFKVYKIVAIMLEFAHFVLAFMEQIGSEKAHPDFPEGLDDAASEFLLACFRPDPDQRPTAKEVSLLES